MLANRDILFDSICENFMLAINNGIWTPFLNADGTWTTHCNSFVHAVASKMGYKGFWQGYPIMANNMVELMLQEVDWMKEKDGEMAQYHANQGSLVIAGQKSEGHGHVCVIRPGNMIFSGKWNKTVPKCANVGKDVFLGKGVNFSFQTEPDYFCLKSSLV